MCYAIPIFADRVAPRCTTAEGILFLVLNGSKVISRLVVPLRGHTWVDLLRLLCYHDADLLVCGGINRETRDLVESRGMRIIENVSCTVDEAVKALEQGRLRPGFGFSVGRAADKAATIPVGEPRPEKSAHNKIIARSKTKLLEPSTLDCLSCSDRVCLRGERCNSGAAIGRSADSEDFRQMLESARDISSEKERILCRLSELIYFCLEMKYKRLGVAFCIDLLEATDILVRVLRRFFEVHPICCKVGGHRQPDPWAQATRHSSATDFNEISCNPQGQAEVLNQIGTDFNVVVGLCMGADCVFTRKSEAPVSTLFVKDKSLANNPIGALYSDYYLQEVTRSAVGRSQ